MVADRGYNVKMDPTRLVTPADVRKLTNTQKNAGMTQQKQLSVVKANEQRLVCFGREVAERCFCRLYGWKILRHKIDSKTRKSIKQIFQTLESTENRCFIPLKVDDPIKWRHTIRILMHQNDDVSLCKNYFHHATWKSPIPIRKNWFQQFCKNTRCRGKVIG